MITFIGLTSLTNLQTKTYRHARVFRLYHSEVFQGTTTASCSVPPRAYYIIARFFRELQHNFSPYSQGFHYIIARFFRELQRVQPTPVKVVYYIIARFFRELQRDCPAQSLLLNYIIARFFRELQPKSATRKILRRLYHSEVFQGTTTLIGTGRLSPDYIIARFFRELQPRRG